MPLQAHLLNFYAQVVVAVTPQDDFAHREYRRARQAEKDADRQAETVKARLAFAATSDPVRKFEIVRNLRYLFGKRCKKARIRVKQSIERGGTFDEVMSSVS